MSATGSSSGKSAGRPAGSATVTVPSSAGSQSQRVCVAAACPRPFAVTSAQHARSRPCPSPSPVHRRVPTRRRTWAPDQSPATSRTPGRAAAPPRGACVSGLWPARVGEPGRSHSRPAATPPPARPGGAGIRDQQGPLGVQAEADGGQHPSLGQSRDSAPHPGRRRPGRQGQAQQAELCHRTTDPRASPPRGSNSRSAGSTGRLPELRAPEGSGHPSGDSIEVGTADMVPSNAGSNHSQAPGIGSVTGPDAADRRVGGDRSIVAYGLSDEISGVTARPRSQRPTPRNVTWAQHSGP